MTFTFSTLFSGTSTADTRLFQFFYTLFRIYCGVSIAFFAGLPKIFHKVDPNGSDDWANLALGVPDWFVKQVSELGFTFLSADFWAILAAYGEFVGGILIAVGLFTRFSAIQMAFQFGVVAFLWYDEPALFAMYYQQLIFWSFVLISAAGSGKFSIDYWLTHRKRGLAAPKSVVAVFALVCLTTITGNAQSEPERVSFIISNASLRSRQLEIRGYNAQKKECIGYGCRLGALQARSDNKPVGTRIYEKKHDRWELVYVLGAGDNGRKIQLSQTHEISVEQRRQVAIDEQNEAEIAREDIARNSDVATIANRLGLDMITFRISGKSPWGKQVHIRAQLPYDDNRSNNGLSRHLSLFKTIKTSYPAGTKIYLCEGPYWNGPVNETLLLTLDPGKNNCLIRL